MKFKPNYKTYDDIFEVELDEEALAKFEANGMQKDESEKDYKSREIEYLQRNFNTDIVDFQIRVYNVYTDAYSLKSLHFKKGKGYYFKGNFGYWGSSYAGCSSRMYYLNKHLVKIGEERK